MDSIFLFFYKLIYTNLLLELREVFLAGKIEDEFLNSKYSNLSKWAEFGRGANEDTVMYISFVKSSGEESGWDSNLRSVSFENYLRDKIDNEASAITDTILEKVDKLSFKLTTEDYRIIQTNIAKLLFDSERIDLKYRSIITEGLVDLQERVAAFKPETTRFSGKTISKLDPVNKNQIYRELSDFCNGLKGFGLIHRDTRIGTFRAAFGFGESEDKIIWTGPKNALRELILMLEREGKIKNLGNEKASVLSSIIELADDPDYDFRKLKTNNDPYSRNEDLKGLISYL